MPRIIFVLGILLGSHGLLAAEFADRVLLNGNVITVDKRDSVHQAIAIKGAHILAVGSTAEIEKLAGPNTEKTDLR